MCMRIQLVPSLMVVLSAVGCGSSTTEDADGKLTLQQPDAKTEIATGTEGVEFPEDFDKDVPVYPDTKIGMVNKSAAMVAIAAETSDSIQQVWDYYEKDLAANKWDNNRSLKTDKGGSISAKKDTRVCTITIVTKDKTGETVVNIMLQSLPQP